MPPNFVSSTSSPIAGDGEGLLHHLGTMVADRARRQLDAVADDVVLERRDAEDRLLVASVERQEGVDGRSSASRTGCGRSRSSSPPRSTHTSGSRRSSRTRSAPSSTRLEIVADPVARRAREACRTPSACRRRRTPRRRPRARAASGSPRLRSGPMFFGDADRRRSPRPRAQKM